MPGSFNRFPLHAIVDVEAAAPAGWEPVRLAGAFLEGGARILQVRAKRLAAGPLLALCDVIVGMAAECGAAVIVNDRVDVARLSGAAGVHVGQDDLSPQAARDQLGADAIVGCSTHTRPQVARALGMPVSYVAVGPVFGTHTKDTGYDAVGLELVRDAARLAGERPIVAIGGVTLANAASVLEAGAASVAVIGDLLATGHPATRVREYLQCLTDIAYSPRTPRR